MTDPTNPDAVPPATGVECCGPCTEDWVTGFYVCPDLTCGKEFARDQGGNLVEVDHGSE